MFVPCPALVEAHAVVPLLRCLCAALLPLPD